MTVQEIRQFIKEYNIQHVDGKVHMSYPSIILMIKQAYDLGRADSENLSQGYPREYKLTKLHLN